jgi:hypothetical protein
MVTMESRPLLGTSVLAAGGLPSPRPTTSSAAGGLPSREHVAHIGSDRAHKTTLQVLHKEWENLTFKLSEDVDDFALRLNTVQQKMVQFGDDTYDKERAVEKLFWCIPKKYKQIARSNESLLDHSMMSIEEAIGCLKVVDGDEPQPLSGPITVGRKLHLTREQWEAC